MGHPGLTQATLAAGRGRNDDAQPGHREGPAGHPLVPDCERGRDRLERPGLFTTTFDGYLLALARDDGQVVCRKKLPAFTNAPIAIEGDTLVTAASYPGGKGQIPEVVAFRLGAHGS